MDSPEVDSVAGHSPSDDVQLGSVSDVNSIASSATAEDPQAEVIAALTSELQIYRHAFETTALDRDAWKHRYQSLEWNLCNQPDKTFRMENLNRNLPVVFETDRFIFESTLDFLKQIRKTLSETGAPTEMPTISGAQIGAEKCGTSFFYSCIREHPDVYVGNKDFGLYPMLKEETPISFNNLFMARYKQEKAIVPFDVGYMFHEDSAALLAARAAQSLRVILVLLRDPIERAVSEYRMRLRQGFEYLPFSEAIALSALRKEHFAGDWTSRWAYLERGLYSKQLEPYVAQFGAEKLMVRLFEQDVIERPGELVCDFLRRMDIDAPSGEAYDARINRGGREVHAAAHPTYTQEKLKITPEKMAAWLDFFPTGAELDGLRQYFESDVRELREQFDLPIERYWKTTTANC